MSVTNKLSVVLAAKTREEIIEIAQGLYGACAFADVTLEELNIDLWESIKNNLDIATDEARPCILKAIEAVESAWELVKIDPKFQEHFRKTQNRNLHGDN